MFVLDETRARVARSVRMILGGRPERQFLMDSANDGLFGPGSITWIIHADAAMLVGGIAALLLQTLQPSAMAAVAEHSDYRTDPLGRLRRTVSFLGTTTYGTRAEATAAIDRLIGIHSRIEGVTGAGVAYRANDPHLLMWVHATEVNAFLEAHRAYGRQKVSPSEYDTYVAEMAIVGEALGVVDAPRTTAELSRALAGYRPELEATELSADAVTFLAGFRLRQPAATVYRTLFTAALLLQPDWAQPLLPITPGRFEQLVVPPSAKAMLASIGWALAYEGSDSNGPEN